MTLADYYNRKIPEYYDYMYLDGYEPWEVYTSFKNTQRKIYGWGQPDEEPFAVNITSEVKIK